MGRYRKVWEVDPRVDALNEICHQYAVSIGGVHPPETGKPFFTGWKEWPGEFGPFDGRTGLIGQWVIFNQNRTAHYVTVPSLENGTTVEGGLMGTGATLLDWNATPEIANEAIRVGYEKLCSVMKDGE